MIKEELRIHAYIQKIKEIYKSCSKNCNNTAIMNESINKINEIVNTERNNETMVFKRFAFIIERNFQDGRFGYIDPTSNWSVSNIRKEISNLPAIDKNKLSFNCCDQRRTLFSKNFERTLHDILTPLINDVFFLV